jgi:Ca2+-binding RTX toxin-like protein
MAIFNGTSLRDVLIGTPQDDTMHGNAGNDRIFGGKGIDALFGDEAVVYDFDGVAERVGRELVGFQDRSRGDA